MTQPDEQEPDEGQAEDRTDWKAEARKWESRAKENTAAAKRLAALEEANKTAEQKATEARTQAERERDDARRELLKRDVADAAGLPKGWARRLQGSTREELEADAKELAKDMPKAPPTSPGGRPVADLKPGALPAGGRSNEFDPDAWIRGLARGK